MTKNTGKRNLVGPTFFADIHPQWGCIMLPTVFLKVFPLFVLLSACTAGPQYEVVDKGQGGVHAKVIEILNPGQVAVLKVPCLPAVVPDGDQLQWLKTEFRRDHMRSSVVTLAYEEQHVSLGEHVEIKPHYCADGKFYQVVRVLRQLPAP
jgi:hypothetical protein